jgi:hypothetical protein
MQHIVLLDSDNTDAVVIDGTQIADRTIMTVTFLHK